MITQDQSGVVALLASPATHAGADVERIDTHASIVFLAGDRAWKLKRAVRYDYLDYSTADRRRAMCEAEVRVNRRIAPALYRGVTAVTRQADGSLAIGGAGHAGRLARGDGALRSAAAFSDRLAEAGVLPLDVDAAGWRMSSRGSIATADRRTNHGGWEAMRRVIDGNAAGFADGRRRHPATAQMRQADRPRAVRARSGRRPAGSAPRPTAWFASATAICIFATS